MEMEKIALICGTVVLCSSIGSCGTYNTITEQKKLDVAEAMQKLGADPLDIPCATQQGTERYCELRAASRK